MELRQYREAVEQEPLTDEEVRLLLGRIGELEVGGSDRATVGAVAEATGHSVVEVARVLDSVRSESFEQRFGHRLDEIEALAHDTASRVYRMETAAPPPPRLAPVEPYGKDVFRPAAGSYQVMIAIAAIMLLSMVLMLAASSKRAPISPPQNCFLTDPQTGRTVPCPWFQTNGGISDIRR